MTGNGPVSTAWNVNSWPSLFDFVLDRKGVIRFRDFRPGNLPRCRKTLVAE